MKLTGIVIVTAIVLLIVFDIGIALHDGNANRTISDFVWKTSHEYPITAFATGVLCGHFFWRVEDT